MVNAIEIKGLNKTYKDFMLKDICLSVPAGSVMGQMVPENLH